ncbi:MAG: YihY/virulence factor BrkB family protein [Dehalococcoidia bacterium]|nr:YihY/virulence factor BrkB family protein [Dehalococcoidia bacterium]
MINQIKRLNTRLQRIKYRLLKIPAVQLISRTAEGSSNHDALQRAAGVAYYAILSIFPLLLGLIALFGFILPSVNLQDELLRFAGKNFPGATDILNQNIVSIVKLRGAMGLLSIVVLFWGASALFSAINLAINRAWDIRQDRPFFISKVRELGMALSVGILFLLSLVAGAIIAILRGVFDLPAAKLMIVDVGSRLVAFLLILAVFLLLYKLIPNTRTYWRYVWPGALLAAILFEIARTSFVFYLETFANYQLIYGSIASIIALLVWIYYSAFIMILGAAFTFQYGRMRYPAATWSGADK